MSAHTPGPWTLDPCASGWMLISNGQDITAEPFDARDADARLIAAAPALLEALRELVSVTERSFDNRHELNAALEAIERATGGAP